MNKTLTALVAIIVAAWGLTYAGSAPVEGSPLWLIRAQGLYLSGLLAIGLMSVAMVLATRPRWLERPLGGMDRVYRTHKWAGILGGVFAALHWLVEMSDDLIKAAEGKAGKPPREAFAGLFDGLHGAAKDLGEFGVYLLLAMLALTLWRRFPYKFWRHLHRAMPAIYLLLAFHSAVLLPASWWRGPSGALLGALLAAGSAAALWSLAGRIGRARQVGGEVVAVSSPAPDLTEVGCRLDAGWPGHRAGQFAFVSFDAGEGAHPYTIASADRGDGCVSFAIKGLGDYTRRLAGRLQPGQRVKVEGPYGRFLLERHDRAARQVWVAGGVGITPFLAWLERLGQGGEAVEAELHYCVRDQRRDPLLERVRTLCAGLPGVRLQLHDGARGEQLTADQLAADGRGRPTEVWFCGPRGLGDALRQGLAGRTRLRFHQEAFELR